MGQSANSENRPRRVVRWITSIGLLLLAVGGGSFVMVATSGQTHRFLSSARVVRTEEWIEASHVNPRLKSGSEYRLVGSLDDIAREADRELTSAQWTAERTPSQISYRTEFETVTLLDRPKDGEVKVIIQSYRKPSLVDRGRLWMRRQGWIR